MIKLVVLVVDSPYSNRKRERHRQKKSRVMSPAILNSLMQDGERKYFNGIPREIMLNTPHSQEKKKIRAAVVDSQHGLDRKMLKFANSHQLSCWIY